MKTKKTLFTNLIFTFVFYTIILVIFLLPKIIHAEALYEVLQSTEPKSLGFEIKTIWKYILDAINMFVIAVLIIIAFAEILHININTYGVKKLLPAILMGVVAANFSMLICRLLVDIANIMVSFFINGPTSSVTSAKSGNNSMLSALGSVAQGLTLTPVDGGPPSAGSIIWFQIGNLLVFAGAIMVYILSFLFIIRNWIIYFLVPLAPLAFMSQILPQTKSLFGQWWKLFSTWVFMPVVSCFWLFLGGLWFSNSALGKSGVLLSFAFAGVCYYMAITTPFKMGGAIMGAWGNVGKKAWSATGGKGVDYMKAKGSANWQARSANIQSAIKRKTGIGSGLDMAQQKLADAEKRRGLVSSTYKGKYIEKKGQKRAKWEIDNASMEGSEDYASKMAREELLKGAKGREWASKKRIKSQEAIAAIESSDKNWEGLNEEMKRNFFQQNDANGQKLDTKSDEYLRRKAVFQQYAKALLDAQIRGAEAKKAAGDLPKIAAEERISIDNAQSKQDYATELKQSFIDFQSHHTITNKTADQQKTYDDSISKLQTAGYDTNKILNDVNYNTITSNELDTSVTEAGAKVKEKIDQLKTQYGSKVVDLPIALQPYVKAKANGDIDGFKKMEGIEKSRTSQYVNTEIREGAGNAVELHSATEMGQTYLHGNATEKISSAAINNYFAGKKSSNDADTNRRIMEFVYAGNKKGLTGRITGDTHVVVQSLVSALHQNQNIDGLKELAENVNKQNETLGLGQNTFADIKSIEQKHQGNKQAIADELNDIITKSYSAGGQKGSKNKASIITAIKGNDQIGLKGYPSSSI